MMSLKHIILSLFALGLVTACASAKVSDRQNLVTGKIPRPGHIRVYDFAATPADVPADSALTGQHSEHTTPQTAEQVATGRRLGALIAANLVEEIRGMGMPSERASMGAQGQINDLVIRGYLLSMEEGSASKRLVIGFGAGGSGLTTAVEAYQVTAQGLRKLGSGTVTAGGSKTPGGALGIVGLAATGNPAGLIVGTGMKAYGEYSGSSKVEGRAKDTAKEIANELRPRFKQQGWIK